jgi:hypothetical protein
LIVNRAQASLSVRAHLNMPAIGHNVGLMWAYNRASIVPYTGWTDVIYYSFYKLDGKSTKHLESQLRGLEHKEHLRAPMHYFFLHKFATTL